MRPEGRDEETLWDLLRAVEELGDVVGQIGDSERLDRFAQLALERATQNVGESANRVSHEFQMGHPEIPWRSLVAQRHVLVHQYDSVESSYGST